MTDGEKFESPGMLGVRECLVVRKWLHALGNASFREWLTDSVVCLGKC
jgi:hypothetical protein